MDKTKLLKRANILTYDKELHLVDKNKQIKVRHKLIDKGLFNTALKISSVMPKDVECLKVFQHMKQSEMDKSREILILRLAEKTRRYPWFLLQLFKLLVEKNKINQAVEVAEKIPDPKLMKAALESCVIYLTHHGLLDQAIKVTDIIPKTIRGCALRYLSNAFIQTDVDKSIKFANSIVDKQMRTEALLDIFKVMIASSQFNKAIQFAKRRQLCEIRGKALRHVVKSLTDRGNTERALEVAKTISVHDIQERAGALSNVVQTLANNDNIDKAIEVSNSIPCELRGSSCQHISQAFARRGDLEQASQIAATLFETDKKERSIAYSTIATAWMEKDEGVKSLEIANKIKDPCIKKNTLLTIIQNQLKKGHLEQIEKFCDSKTLKESDRGIILASTTIALAQLGDINEAISTAEKISDSRLKRQVYRSIGVAFAKQGNISKALKLTQRKATLDTIGDICAILVKKGKIDEAINIAKNNGNLKKEIMQTILKALLEIKDLDKALEIVGSDLANLKLVYRALIRHGDLTRAEEIAKVIRPCLNGVFKGFRMDKKSYMQSIMDDIKLLMHSDIGFDLCKVFTFCNEITENNKRVKALEYIVKAISLPTEMR